MSRISKEPEERKNEILDAAQELFNTKGFEQTTVSDIVKKIGVAQGTFYYYFKSKNEVANAVIEKLISERLEKVQAVAADNRLNSYEKLAKMVESEFVLMLANYSFLDYAHSDANIALHQKLMVNMIKQYTPVYAKVVKEGVQEGYFNTRHVDTVTEFCLCGFHFIFDPSALTWNVEEFHRKMNAAAEILERLLGVKQDSFVPLFASLTESFQRPES